MNAIIERVFVAIIMTSLSNNSNSLPQLRYERKYLIPSHCPEYLETLVMMHPFFFKQIYHPRIINNIYFDNHTLDSYFANLDGLGDRHKYRVRWYSPVVKEGNIKTTLTTNTSSPHFEIKHRAGDSIRKFLFSSGTAYQAIHQLLPVEIRNLFALESSINENDLSGQSHGVSLSHVKTLKPIIFNSYERKYFLSHNKKVRVTIDSQVKFLEIRNGTINWTRVWLLPATILEIKGELADDSLIAECAKYLPLPLTKSSKYVLGVMSCLPDIESPLYNIPVRPKLMA